jgi:hypothetical protein
MAGDSTKGPAQPVPLDAPSKSATTATRPDRTATSPTSARAGEPAVVPRTVKCPKCGADAREVARFCQRCHMTLRYSCPACKNEQRKGGTCEKCGVDFLKYIVAVVDAKRDTRDVEQERLDRRSGLIKNVLMIPLTGGLSLLKLLRPAQNKSK